MTHEKAIVIDNTAVWILNHNLTTAAFDKNREYDVLDTDLADVAEVRTIFLADWDRKGISLPTDTHLIVSPVTA